MLNIMQVFCSTDVVMIKC